MKSPETSTNVARKPMLLDELCQELSVYGECEIRRHGKPWGESECELYKDGVLRARWKSRLINIVPLDGVTPRGPSEYYDLVHLPAPESTPEPIESLSCAIAFV